ncbi:ATP-binding protein [Streptomyces sp. NEAU-Y11]|uniref:ATP-binding protein n=1 Tax=Streptomyces cucumeris TaxID=2962890 RepID=UPI0020C8A95B|nr:ATP-binding protein [Streptomyces sp. NEAU-Y11]MCP9208544.1 ATP-binding protein [Streptomyces sp. NEAU-Y11]
MKSHGRTGDRATAAAGHPGAHTAGAVRHSFAVSGIPRSADAVEAGLLRTRLIAAAKAFSVSHGPRPLTVTLTNRPWPADERIPDGADPAPAPDEPSTAERARWFTATAPLYTFDRLVLPEGTLEHLLRAVHTVERRGVLFDDWGLRSIQPHPSSAVNLEGGPGTGKTLAAHAIADRLGRPVIVARGSQLESKFHGEGPKNLAALFHAAREQGAVLFLDEADSLMSARFETTSHGSEAAVNAMRSEMLTALDSHEGLVVFATNLVTAYDTAFDSRVWHVRFPSPDRAARTQIWRRHLPEALPRDDTVSPEALAEVDDVTGRDICRAVIDAAAEVLRTGRNRVGQRDLLDAVERIKAGRPRRGEPAAPPTPVPAPPGVAEAVANAVPSPREG